MAESDSSAAVAAATMPPLQSAQSATLPAAFLPPTCPEILQSFLLASQQRQGVPQETPFPLRVVSCTSGKTCLLWSPEECVRLRRKFRVAAIAIGNCAQKVSTNGKLAAVPVVVEDDVLYLGAHLHWWTLTDSATQAAVSPWSVLHDNLARSPDPLALRMRRIVCADLWAKGYRMTTGIKFGVDYLVYVSDPTVCHAAFMVLLKPQEADGSETIAPLDLVTRSRVATTALKICVLAYVNAGAGSVNYSAFRRMGPGHVSFQPSAAVGAAGGAPVSEEPALDALLLRSSGAPGSEGAAGSDSLVAEGLTEEAPPLLSSAAEASAAADSTAAAGAGL